MKDEAYKPLTVQELEAAFGIADSSDFKEFVKALVQMEEKGLVVRTRSNRYGLPQKMNLIRGKLTGHAKGFAFVIPDEPGMDDIFIPPNETNTAMHGDTVLARISSESSGQRREGSIIRILSGEFSKLLVPMWRAKALALLFQMIKSLQVIFLSQNLPQRARLKVIK